MVKHAQTIRRLLQLNGFSVFGYFVGLVLNGLILTFCSHFVVRPGFLGLLAWKMIVRFQNSLFLKTIEQPFTIIN